MPTVTGDAWQTTQLFRDDAPPELFNEDGEFTFACSATTSRARTCSRGSARRPSTSLTIGLAAVLIIVVIGIFIGSIAGYVGGWVDNLLMRFVDIMLSLPGLFIILHDRRPSSGRATSGSIIIAIGIDGLDDGRAARARRVPLACARSTTSRRRARSARARSASSCATCCRRRWRRSWSPRRSASPTRWCVESALSFLGFGIGRDSASLGTMLQNARDYFFRGPLKVLYPGVVLILIVLSASFLGDGLRDALDPRQRVEK